MKRLLTIISVLFLAQASYSGENQGPSQPAVSEVSTQHTSEPIPGQYIVVFKSSRTMGTAVRTPSKMAATAAQVERIAAAVGARTENVYSSVLEGFSAKLTEAQVEALRNDPAVDFIEQDQTAFLFTSQEVPWGVTRQYSERAQAAGQKGAGVKVGVLDTGIDYLHPDLAGNYIGGYDFWNNDADPMDDRGHGTHVAGTIAGMDNNIGVLGAAPSASLYAIKVFGSIGTSPWSTIAAGLDWCVANGMDVVNMSLGGGYSAVMELACNNAYNSGTILVASAGNNRGAVLYPAKYSSVIAVSAIDFNDNLVNNIFWGSNSGPEIEVAAHGNNVYSTYPTNKGSYQWMSGTSMASPHITGVVAQIISTGNFLTPTEVRNQLLSTTQDVGAPGRDNQTGYGIPNALAAIGQTIPQIPIVEFLTNLRVLRCAPLTLDFRDISTGNPTSWYWDFGDGTTSTLQNSSHTYVNGGSYTVTLTATNSFGTATLTKVDYVPVNFIPIPDFTADKTVGPAPLTVTFTDLSVANPVQSTFWDFGDYGTATGPNPTIVFDKPGDYKVSLRAFNFCGNATALKEAYIIVTEGGGGGCNTPVSAFSGTPTTGVAPLTVSFTDQSTNAPFAWTWNFGDLGKANVQNPSHTYPLAGTYTVTMTSGNACGENTVTQVGYVVVSAPGCVAAPVAGFAGTPTAGNTPLTVSFTDQSTNNPAAWAWDFGDGATSALQNPSHVYAGAGTYTVALTATNSCGSNLVTQLNYITVTDPGCAGPPVAGFSAVPPTGAAPLSVNFSDQSTNVPIGWSWDFGDGGTSVSQNPNHVYTTAGTYSVSLTATNGCGSNQMIQANLISVTGGCTSAPVADFSGAPTQGFAPLTVSFTDLSTGGGDSWEWMFGDDGMSTQQDPTYTYTKPGDYKVILMVSNACGSDVIEKEKFISVPEGQGGQGAGQLSVTPVAYELTQNYPNPFNPSTEISFALPVASDVRIDVYNILGKKVESLANGRFEAGWHTVTWNASNVASGIYFYRLETGETIETRKMLLLK